MLQVAFIRNNTELVKQRLAVKNFAELNLIDEILKLDDERKRLQLEFETSQAKVNSISKEIGQLMAKGLKEDAENKKLEVSSLKSLLQPINEKLVEVEKKLQDTLVLLPNLPSEKVPSGKTPADNIVVREGGVKPQLPAGSVPLYRATVRYHKRWLH